MARIRTIKPEFWTSEQIVECSANARLLFIGLWNFCDDNGIHPANAMRLKMEIFPADPFTKNNIQELVNELINHELIKEYTVENESYWIVTGWKHQRIDQPTYKYPLPSGDTTETPKRRRTFDDCSANTNRTDAECSPPERKGKEKERNIYTPDFLSFWNAYPKKSGSKKAAYEQWKKLNGNKPDIETILIAIKSQIEWREKARDGDFRPEWKDPERWIKNHMWEAELTENCSNNQKDPWEI